MENIEYQEVKAKHARRDSDTARYIAALESKLRQAEKMNNEAFQTILELQSRIREYEKMESVKRFTVL